MKGAVSARPVVNHDLVGGALATCLSALAELALATGHSDPVVRLLEAAEELVRASGRERVAPGAYQPPSRGVLSVGLAAGDGSPLTAREREVAVLIARGLTNRQIASHLVISERTADTHVQNILGKLGLVSRAQAAAWVIEQILRTRLRDEAVGPTSALE
jgi:DNA-binding NarL/FixJ family response regulator